MRARVIKGITKQNNPLPIIHERIEVIGPFALLSGRERWKVMVFNDQGTLVEDYDTYSKQDADALKTDLAKEFASRKPPPASAADHNHVSCALHAYAFLAHYVHLTWRVIEYMARHIRVSCEPAGACNFPDMRTSRPGWSNTLETWLKTSSK